MINGITEINLPSYATLSSATMTDNEMGDKTIETTVAIDASVVPDFTFPWELEFKGERYIQPFREPQGNKSNESIRAHLNLTFYHKTIYQLKRYFFFETASVGVGTVIADKYNASVYLNLGEFVTLFNEVLGYYFGDDIVMDLNPSWVYSDEKVFIEISSSYIWDVLQKVNELYGVRWKIIGDTIYVGYADTELTHIFEYGFDGGLMKLERQVQDASIRNQLLGRGGSKNLPQYYFKTAPEGSGFTSDPDACPELQYVYFDELRGKTFRDYVKGWNAKHHGGTPMTNPTLAYNAGYTDEKFNPIEYVEDRLSIQKYGVLQGILDSNEDIYPSIKGRTVSPFGRVDEIIDAEEPDKDNYDQEEHAVNDSKTTVLTTLSESIKLAAYGTASVTLPKSPVFTVPAGKVGTIDPSWICMWTGFYRFSSQPVDAKAYLNYDVDDIHVNVYNAVTGEEVSAVNLPSGDYYYIASGSVSSSSSKEISASFSISNVKLIVSTPGVQSWKYTFDIWVKNIWNTTQNTGESDEDYAHRVWAPILGSHGEEARVLFDSGWLYGHEDWEFPIISVAKDRSKSRGGVQSEWRITLKKSDAEMEATGKYIPSSESTVQAHAGDYFHFIGIDMPFFYVEMAEADLDEYKTEQLLEYAEIKPTWVVTMDHVRMNTKLGQESQTFYEQFESGAMVYIKNKQLTDNAAIAFYLESITYTWSSDTVIIPSVEVVLSDKIKTVFSPVALMQGDIRSLSTQVGSLKEAAVRASVASASMYLPKDGTPAMSYSETTFAKNVTGKEFRSGLLGGADWGIYRDEDGKAIIEADKVVAREQLVVNDIVVNQITYQGGMQIISAASMECVRVDNTSEGYICYFDQKQGSVANLFKVGDVAYSHIFDESELSLKYYKRKVEGVGANYILLSKTVFEGNGIPQAGDNIIQFGSYTNEDRQFVIVRDVIGGGYERMISGLDSVSASGNEYYYAGKYNGLERWFVGNKAEGGSYAEYLDGVLNIAAQVNILPGSSGIDNFPEFVQVQTDLEDVQNQLALLDDDTVFDVQEKAYIRTLWENINGIASTIAGSETKGSYALTKKNYAETVLPDANSIFVFNGIVYTHTDDNIAYLYNTAGMSDLDNRYLLLRNYLNSVGLYDSTATFNFDREVLDRKFTEYYDAEKTVVDNVNVGNRKRLDEMGYLQSLLNENQNLTTIEGGVILSTIIGVREFFDLGEDVPTPYMVAGMNSSNLAKDDDHGVLMLFAGATDVEHYPDAEDTGNRVAASKFRVYEDGHVVAEDIEAKGGHIGKFELGNWLTASDPIYGGSYEMELSNINWKYKIENIECVDEDTSLADLNCHYSSTLLVKGPSQLSYSTTVLNVESYLNRGDYEGLSMLENIGITLNVHGASLPFMDAFNEAHGGNHALKVINGTIAGLRPEIRNMGGSLRLSEYDHTVFCTQGGTITLPSSPKYGQEYMVVHATSSRLTIQVANSSKHKMYSTYSSGYVDSINVDDVQTVWLAYLEGITLSQYPLLEGIWVMQLLYKHS